ncbi:DsbA family protein, partial [Streptomyces sp. NPDC059082]
PTADKKHLVALRTVSVWALQLPTDHAASGVQGTPTLKMDGKPVTVAGTQNPPMTVAEFDTAITTALKG